MNSKPSNPFFYFFTRSSILGLVLWVGPWMPAVGQNSQLSGQILDGMEQSPLGYASVAIFAETDSSQVGGTLTDSLGRFSLSSLSAGDYYLELRFLGYEAQFEAVSGLAADEQRSLGSLTLQPTARLLEEIEITGRESQSFHRIDRQVYDAQQFDAARGGTAVDVLRNLPGVSVNGQGEISLRGSQGFLIMVDGRQFQGDPSSFLNQLPANGIKNIEILTTPSAKYDPDGAAGIINITTRKGAADGLYLQVNGLLGAPSIEPYGNAEASRRYGADLTLNWRKAAWDLSLGLDYNRDDLAGRRVGYVNTYLGDTLTEFPSVGERSFDRERYSVRASINYRPNTHHSFALSFLAGDRTQYRTADILYATQQRSLVPGNSFLGPEAYWDLFQQTGTVLSGVEVLDSLTYFNENLRVRQGDFLIGGLDYTWDIKEGNNLRASALYERTLLGGPTDNASLAWPNVADTLQYQFNTNDNPLDGFRVKLDYQQKLGEVNWESGYQYRFLFHPGDFLYLDRDLENGRFVENPLFTNRIELRRQIHSLYTQFYGQWKRLQYNAGLRLEYMDRRVSLAQPDTTYLYQIIQPFPTLNLLYDLGKDWRIKAGYSRRIERTTTFKMTPFPEREHNETLEQGDAELLPEFIDLVEVGLIKNWGDNSLFVTGYLRNIQNVINRVNTVFNDSILNRIYTNVGQAQALGVELGSQIYPTKWLQVYLGGNVYQYQIQGTLFGDEINTANLIYSINANAQVDLPASFKLQAGFNYLSERVTAQGVDSRFYNPSLTLTKSFQEGRWSLALQWLSIDMGLLESNEQRITTVRDNFFTTTNYVYEVDRVLLTLSYRINSRDDQVKFIKSEFGEKEY